MGFEELIIVAFKEAFSVASILYLVAGVTAGILLGAIPGLSAAMGIALVIPFTLTLGPVPALLMMMGAYKGGIYGGSIAAILIKAPGTAAAAATVEDGHALAKQGKGLKALKVSLISSVVGDMFSDIVLILTAVHLAKVALHFGPVEYTAIAFVALVIIGSASGKSLLKGLLAAFAGLLAALIGSDPTTGMPRLTFDVIDLYGGLSLVPMLIGILTVAELLRQVEQRRTVSVAHLPPPLHPDDSKVTREDVKLIVWPIASGSIIGTLIGIIPGLGPTLGAFLGYGAAQRLARKPKLFGRGSVEGISGAESGNNAVSGANIIPLLGLGIPGDVEAAILIGAFLIHGLTPGPLIFIEAPQVIYGIYVGLIFSNILLLAIGYCIIPWLTRVASVRVGLLLPVVLFMAVIGSYAYQQSIFDVGITFTFGVIGFFMIKLEIPRTTFLIGFILGPLLEDNFRRALQISNGSYSIFTESTLGNILWLTAAILAFSVIYKQWVKVRINGERH